VEYDRGHHDEKSPTAMIIQRFTFVVRRDKSTSGTPLLSLSIAIN